MINDIFESVIYETFSLEDATRAFFNLVKADDNVREAYYDWCLSMGYKTKDGFREFYSNYYSQKDNCLDTMFESGEEFYDYLLLVGDIIDGWSLKRGSKRWNEEHTAFVKKLLDLQHTTKIIYIMGNHNDFLTKIIPLKLFNITILRDYIYESFGRRYYVLHGDVFDHVTTSFGWLSKLGDIGYHILLRINRRYNLRRQRKGLPYYSISQEIKSKVKASVSYISNFEKHIVNVARRHNCDGVICGHIYQAEKRKYGEVLYLNSGDWVESLTALTEDYVGNWSIYKREEDESEQMEEFYKQVLLGAI